MSNIKYEVAMSEVFNKMWMNLYDTFGMNKVYEVGVIATMNSLLCALKNEEDHYDREDLIMILDKQKSVFSEESQKMITAIIDEFIESKKEKEKNNVEVVKRGSDRKWLATCPKCRSELRYSVDDEHEKEVELTKKQKNLRQFQGMDKVIEKYIICPECEEEVHVISR